MCRRTKYKVFAMKKKLFLTFLLLQVCISLQQAFAQQFNYKPPLLIIDFGSQGKPPGFYMDDLKEYNEQRGPCPDDGNYSFAPRTNGCFNGDWITMTEDHTPGDTEGRMLLVNAAHQPGTFFKYSLSNIKPNTMYEFSCWIVNVCRTSSPCNPTRPQINFIFESGRGGIFKMIRTGAINPTNMSSWRRHYGEFTTPADVNNFNIRMDDATNGGCGNDFAIDDIMLREIEIKPAEPEVRAPSKPVVTKPVPAPATTALPAKKPEIKKPDVIIPATPPLKKNTTNVAVEKDRPKPAIVNTTINQKPVKATIPDVLVYRTNPVVKEISTEETEMLIQLYDNGEVDGDTVTVYDNNVLLAANAGLSEKPVTIKIKVDKQHPHHELVMVANNLGSIPTNTSLMVITANDKRYEVFISSSKQKNAKILINLLE